MSFDRAALIAACRRSGSVARVVVARVRGSAPREVGAAMLVWQDGASGTIGGGTLEHRAMQAARADLTPGPPRLTRHALGPDLGQCCGGSVELVTQVFDLGMAQALADDVILSGQGEMPEAVARLTAQMRAGARDLGPLLQSGWMIEPVQRPARQVWIWGAGHVGRALVDVLAPLPDLHLTWIDVDTSRFPDCVPEGVDVLITHAPETLVPYAPRSGEHLIVTYAHDLDLALCHHLLGHGFATAGLIGSATKWARFRSRLSALGHSAERIARIDCPIGDPSLGKHPQAIALGVGARLLTGGPGQAAVRDSA